jgi:hypothetical protein
MRALVAAVVLLVFLAGCSEDQSEVPDPAVVPTPSPTTAEVVVAEPTVEVIPISFDGTLGTQVHGCVFPAGVCQTQAVVPESGDLVVERPGAILKAIDLTATWTAASPATATLHFGYMVMTHCEGCNSTTFGDVEKGSPVIMQVSDVAIPLDEDTVVHVYAYNPTGVVYDPNVPGYAVVSAEQAYHIEGTITIEIPPATP